MAEGPSNVEIAHHVHERGTGGNRHSRRVEFAIEIGEALLLALVAIATAWSGYQAVRWDGEESKLYGESSRLNFAANAENTRRPEAGLQRDDGQFLAAGEADG